MADEFMLADIPGFQCLVRTFTPNGRTTDGSRLGRFAMSAMLQTTHLFETFTSKGQEWRTYHE
jgi:hypothetical protein